MEREYAHPHHRHHIPSNPNDETAIAKPSSNLILRAQCGIYNANGREDDDDERARQGKGWERVGGGMQRKYVHANLALSLSLFSSHLVSGSLPPTTTTQTSHLELIRPKRGERDRQRKAQEGGLRGERGKRSPKKAKQASGKRSSLYPSTKKGGPFWFRLRNREEGRDTPFFCFDCHLIQFIAHLFLCGHFFLLFFFSYIRIPALVAALEQQCFYCA